jgi:hypothetical protein
MTAELNTSNSWMKKNRTFLLLLLTVLLGGGLVNYWIPYQRLQSQKASWEIYTQAQQDVRAAETASDYTAILNAAQDDSRVYPWVVTLLANNAAGQGHSDALALLQGALKTEQLIGIHIQEDGTSANLLQTVAGVISSELEAKDITPGVDQETSTTVKITLTDDAERVYMISFSVYSTCPRATTALLNAAGQWAGGAAKTMGAQGVELSLPEGTSAESIPLERSFGAFHSAGALCLKPVPTSTTGEQDAGVLAILTQDSYTLDGRSTVLGMLKTGQEDLDALAALEPDPENPGQLLGNPKITEIVWS